MKKNLLSFLTIFLIFKILVVTISCANIIPPTGGPRDSLPPVLISAVPKDSDLSFKARKITLTFNEYVQLDPQSLSSVITSPNPVQPAYIESHLQTVTVRLKDSLKPNTTYSINFGNTIKDVNEGNIYKNFTYVFSTGSNIVNGSVSGNVQLAQTGLTDSTLIVILHKNLNDSAIKKERPYYYARLDSAGNFRFRYLEYGTYAMYVLPNDYTKKYDDSTKLFAFLNAPVIINGTPPPPVTLYAYNEYPPGKEQGDASVTPAKQNANGKKKNADTAIIPTNNLQRNEQDLLGNFVISFAKPVAHFDSSEISLNDTSFRPLTNYRITPDSLYKNFTISYPWKEDEFFKLILQKNAFADSSGYTLAKTDTLSFKTSSESSYGSIRLRFNNLDFSRKPVIQFVQNNVIVDSAALMQKEFYRKLFKPGEYSLRILYDADGNLTWTPGNFEFKKQPEIVISLPRKLTIKQNWDNEVNINL